MSDGVTVEKRTRSGRGRWGCLALALALNLGCAGQPYRLDVGRAVDAYGARLAVAEQVALGLQAQAAGRWDEVALRLHAVWPWVERLRDSRPVRDLLAAVPDGAVPSGLRSTWRVAQAWAAFQDGRPIDTRTHLAAVGAPGSRVALDAESHARFLLLKGLLARREDPDGARVTLQRAALAAPPGSTGGVVEGVARLAAASIAQEQSRYGEAMEELLRIARDSGAYRDARHALAWCQYHRDRPERAYRILALLPGGTPGSPARAVLAAMAAHAMGQLEASRAIVAQALEGYATWRAAEVTVEAVLSQLQLSGGAGPSDRGAEGIVHTVADHRSVRSLGLELLATREALRGAPEHEALTTWESEILRRLRESVGRSAQEEEARATVAAENLRALLPQLVAP